MATFHDRTLTPKFQGRLLRDAGPCRVLTGDEMVAEVEAEFGSLAAQPWPENDQPENIGLAANHPAESGLVASYLVHTGLAAARTLQSRRALVQAAEHGFALFDALDLPPLALDVIDEAIAHLDALEASDEDREDGHDAEETSIELAGRGLVRCGDDDAEDDGASEDDDPVERDDEHGSDDAEDIGHHASQFAPRPLTRVQRAEVAVIAARAATLRRALHV